MIQALLVLALTLQADKAAEEALEKYKAAYKNKDSGARVMAVQELAKTSHEKVITALAKALMMDTDDVRAAAAEGLGLMTTGQRKAALFLAQALAANGKSPTVLAAILKALGKLKEEGPWAEVEKRFSHTEIDVASAALEASGGIRSANFIMPLIKLLKSLENEGGLGNGGGNNATRPGGGGGTQVGGRNLPNVNSDRPKKLMPDVKKALGAITKQELGDSKAWEAWWRENAATFKVEK